MEKAIGDMNKSYIAFADKGDIDESVLKNVSLKVIVHEVRFKFSL